MTKIADILDIPQQVHQGDFVLKLTEGMDHPEETLRSYVVTPQLVTAFDQSLALIQSALETGRSKGVYLHGSFGSGKSHFMAVLSLLLRGESAARAVPELAGIVTRHNGWSEGKRFLVVPYHLIGAVSLESAVLGQYAEYVRALHPDAPTPGFYRAERLFDDARRLRAQMGDERFFETLSEGAGSASSGGWGAFDASWDAGTFEAALDAAPGSEERARLVGDLVDAFYASQRDLASGREEGFVSLDEGLVILSRHARDLGYDGVVLFLDELILWLGSHAADPAWVAREGQKVVKLVEAERLDRALPIVSFIARQRDLKELVGEHMPGADQLGFADVLNYWDARFDKITLEDRNLPAIIQKRVLRPRDAAAAQALEAAFAKASPAGGTVLDTLLTREGDRDMFRQVYPFSPVLVTTLVALSSLLQRERTALKLLVQLLVDQRETLAVGDLVPVGDLYDVIEGGDEPFSQAMKLRFDQARRLYRGKLLPLLEEQHGVLWEDVAAGRADEAKARAMRGDARLLKTLILASLADGVEALSGLTPSRLAALNHGTVRAPVPGAEGQLVLSKVRSWAARVGEIKVGDDARNPTISVHLVGVDTESIVENAKASDNTGNRIRAVRRLLFEMVGLPDDNSFLPPKHEILWKGTTRECEVLFGNVRELPAESFEPAISGWRVVVDYPFDDRDHTPRNDEAKLDEYRLQGRSTRTIVWIPSFLTPHALDDLGRLVVLEHVLSGQRLDEYGAHLSQQDRAQGRILLTNQRDQIRQKVRSVLLAAYAVSSLEQDALDPAAAPIAHFHALEPGLHLRPPVGADFRDALEGLVDQALTHQYPGHPDFESPVKTAALKKLYEVVKRAASAPDGRVEVDRADRDTVRRIAVPLKLGQMGEAHFVLDGHWRMHFEREKAQQGASQITVRQLREWINRPLACGLPTEAENLVILAFALQTNRTFYLHGGRFEPTLERLQDELELREEPLPDERDWQEAKRRAELILGLSLPAVRSASGVATLIDEAQRLAAERQQAVATYAATLRPRLELCGLAPAQAPRAQTAEAAAALVAAIKSARREDVVRTLAAAPLATSEAAMATAIARAKDLCGVLERTQWDLLKGDTALREPYGSRLSEAIAGARQALAADEHVSPLAASLRAAEQSAIQLLQEAARQAPPPTTTSPPTAPTPPTPAPATPGAPRGASGAHANVCVPASKVEAEIGRLREEAQKEPDAWVELSWRIVPK